MKTTDVKCPVCGAMNRNLYLEETDGWMECDECGNTMRLLRADAAGPAREEPARWQLIQPVFSGRSV